MTTATPTEGQRLNAILTDFLQSNHTLIEIAHFHKMTVLELLEWSRQPKVKEILDAVYTLSRQRIRTIRAEAHITSLRRLDLIAASSDHEETARRAAMGLLRGPSRRRKSVPPTLPGVRGDNKDAAADHGVAATADTTTDNGAAANNRAAAKNGAATVKERPISPVLSFSHIPKPSPASASPREHTGAGSSRPSAIAKTTTPPSHPPPSPTGEVPSPPCEQGREGSQASPSHASSSDGRNPPSTAMKERG